MGKLSNQASSENVLTNPGSISGHCQVCQNNLSLAFTDF